MTDDREQMREEMQYTAMDHVVSGEKIYLGPLNADYLPIYRRWINSLRVSVPLQIISMMTLPVIDEDEQVWFESTRTNPHESTFGIYERDTNVPVGNISLSNISHRDGTAELGLLVGNTDRWGRGYATEALQLLLDYAFTVLGLHVVQLRCVAFNIRALKIYHRIGFQKSGVLRQAWRLGQRRYDVVLMDILAEEFTSPVLARQLSQQFGIDEE